MTDCNPTILKAELQSLSVINERLNCEIGNLKIELETLRQENRRLRKALTRIKSLNYDVNHYAGVQSYLAASNALKPPRSH